VPTISSKTAAERVIARRNSSFEVFAES
jgi:hypothetical protein